jgi:hypothetical protein
VQLTAKIPDQAWLLEIDRGKLHVRLQIRSRFLEKRIGRKKPRDERRNDKSNCKIDGGGCKSAISEETCRVFRGQPASKQKGKQRKRRQGVMRQLGFDEREDDENDRDTGDKVAVDLIACVVAGAADTGRLPSPQLSDQPRQFDRPRKKT